MEAEAGGSNPLSHPRMLSLSGLGFFLCPRFPALPSSGGVLYLPVPTGRLAEMAELVDALDLGSSSRREWGFKSPSSHHEARYGGLFLASFLLHWPLALWGRAL